MELHKILIGMSLTIIMVFGFVFFLAEGVDKYNPSTIPSNYNESFIKITDSMQSLNNITVNSSGQSNIVGTGTSSILSDFLGFFFGQAYKAGQVLIGGLSLLNVFVDEAITQVLGTSAMGAVVKGVLVTIILIMILAILLHFVIKSDRI